MKLLKIIRDGSKNGLSVVWELAKVMIPIITLVNFLEYLGFLESLADVLMPVMSIFSLPGEAALVLIIGNLTTVYGAVAAMLSLDFSAVELTILSTMVAICHSMLTETVIAKKTGAKPLLVVGSRLVMSIIAGIILGQIL
ncbi:nucleoside recognition domain-containing protein [Proteinivorax hydrogeniformans]|uniref:Nucleoside recognition domain-containing protein n=1 Tax=Proteinivorax hydrogeniformans TaxID=1826727 RepID=A0AAU8HQ96_9FIRM